MKKANLLAVLKEASEVFRACSRKLKILSTISWGGELADEFFKNKESVLPQPKYNVDREALKKITASLKDLSPKLKGEHPVLHWLTRTLDSYGLAAQLLGELETKQFYEISSQLYGSPLTQIFNGQTSNLDLANSIESRMSVCTLNDLTEKSLKTAEDFAAALELRIKNRVPYIPVRVELSDEISAKVVAGTSRVRIRRNARFSDLEVCALWNHEIETHCLTAHNGLLQENCDFLAAAGPRTTMTQEGLSVFFEMYGHSMSQSRFLALCHRVHAIRLVEEGADFIELYRWYRERSGDNYEAFFAASRIFRGSPIAGGAPFTKDVVYLAGLLGVYNFLQIAVKNQNRLLVESLVCGRMSLEDVGTIAWLRTHGVLSPPKYVPEWLENWEALLSFFSFSAFINTVDLGAYRGYFDNYNTLQDWDFSV